MKEMVAGGFRERTATGWPLSPLERALKCLYLSGLSYCDLREVPEEVTEILRASPSDEAEFWKIRQCELTEDILDEHLFFEEEADIHLNVHPRYLAVPAHTHHFFELQYVLGGSPVQAIGNATLSMWAGDVCFIAPGTWHRPLVFDDDTLLVNILIRKETFHSTFVSLLRTNDMISDFFARVLYCSSFYPYMLCRGCMEDALISTILDMVQTAADKSPYRSRLLKVKLEEFFINLLRYHQYDFVTASVPVREHKSMVAILSYIQRNFRTIKLSDMAQFFKYNESHLSRIIKSQTGSTFSTIVKNVRLHYAAGLLEGSTIPVSKVIADSGYEDKTYFYREFRKKFGMTPAEYRRRTRRHESGR